MHWLRAHPYLAALAGAVVLITLGAFVVGDRTPAQPARSPTLTWEGAGSNLLNPTLTAPNFTGVTQENIYSEVASGPPFHFSSPSVQFSPAGTEASGEFDLEAFLAMLSSAGSGASSGGQQDVSNGSLDAYSFIPGGLISVQSSEDDRTPTQQTLYTYGNEVGSTIQSFEGMFPNAAQILKDQFEDKENPSKIAAVKALAGGFAEVARALEAMEEIPKEIRTAHTKVAESYRDLGKKLSLVPNAGDGQALLDAMLAYNTAVEAYVKNYVALATLFSAYGVKFSRDDPGSVFTFTATPSL